MIGLRRALLHTRLHGRTGAHALLGHRADRRGRWHRGPVVAEAGVLGREDQMLLLMLLRL